MSVLQKLRLWPRTLSMQLILVTAAAVLFSNLAVAYWFEYGNEKQFENYTTGRLFGRTGQLVGSLSAVPADVRCTVTRYASQNPYRFTLRSGKVPVVAMNEEEKQMAAQVTDSLPQELAKSMVMVDRSTLDLRTERRNTATSGQGSDLCFNRGNAIGQPGAGRGGNGAPGGGRGGNGPQGGRGGGRGDNNNGPVIASIVEAAVQVDDQSYLVARYTRVENDSQPWPIENRIATLLSIIVTAGGAMLLARRMSKPLAKLTAAASEVAKGGAAPRVPEEGPDDVRRAAVAFNAMTDQVQRTLANQRQLLTAVGHDLRTPITAMRISLEFMDDGETRESLEKNLNELQQLTEAVLSSAKGAGGEKKRNVDLAALLDSLCADMEELGKPVSWENHGPAPLFCRPNEITRAARNLIENALAYGQVARVRLAETPSLFEIVVDDDGPGIPATDRERVFEPFVRLETSRNLATGGTGLGLTLVKAIAEGHGGNVVLENRPEGGLRVRLQLPRN